MAIYDTFYDLLNTYIFGGGIAVGTYADLVCILLSTIACLFCVALPFIVIWKAIKLFVG